MITICQPYCWNARNFSVKIAVLGNFQSFVSWVNRLLVFPFLFFYLDLAIQCWDWWDKLMGDRVGLIWKVSSISFDVLAWMNVYLNIMVSFFFFFFCFQCFLLHIKKSMASRFFNWFEPFYRELFDFLSYFVLAYLFFIYSISFIYLFWRICLCWVVSLGNVPSAATLAL